MSTRRAFALGHGVSLCLLVGCGSGSAADAGSDACPEGEIVDYVIESYRVPAAPEGPMQELAPGVDLDDQVSTGEETDDCTDLNPDFTSPVTGTGGVDNQLTGSLYQIAQGFSPIFDLDPQLDAEIASGRNVLAIRLHGVDDLHDDANVCLELVRLRDRACALDFCAVADLAGVDAWTPRGVPVASGVGSIRDGVLEARLESFPLVFQNALLHEILVRDARLRCEVTATSLSRCELGGALLIDDVVAFVDAESTERGFEEIVRGILLDSADLRPSTADPLVCDALSAGLELTAVSARIE